jgi:hypothetical protein
VGRPTAAEIAARLLAADEEVPDDVLADILTKLADSGQILMVQRQIGYPVTYQESSMWPFAISICSRPRYVPQSATMTTPMLMRMMS